MSEAKARELLRRWESAISPELADDTRAYLAAVPAPAEPTDYTSLRGVPWDLSVEQQRRVAASIRADAAPAAEPVAQPECDHDWRYRQYAPDTCLKCGAVRGEDEPVAQPTQIDRSATIDPLQRPDNASAGNLHPMDDGPRAEGDAKRMSNVANGITAGEAAANAGMGGFSRSDNPTRPPHQACYRLIHALTDALRECGDAVRTDECPRGIANRIAGIVDYAIDAAIDAIDALDTDRESGEPVAQQPPPLDITRAQLIAATYRKGAARIERLIAAQQPEAPTLADYLLRYLRVDAKYMRSEFRLFGIADNMEEAAARIESDAERIRVLEQRVGEAENRIETDDKLIAASRERERAEKERGDELWQQCENLRVALRDLAIQCEPLEAGSWIACCMVCKRPSWRLGVDPENHAPGCLATPDSAAEPTGGEG